VSSVTSHRANNSAVSSSDESGNICRTHLFPTRGVFTLIFHRLVIWYRRGAMFRAALPSIQLEHQKKKVLSPFSTLSQGMSSSSLTLYLDISIWTITTVVEGLEQNVPSPIFPNLLYFLACMKLSTSLGNGHHLHFPGPPLPKECSSYLINLMN
jgi:hypothetical protein